MRKQIIKILIQFKSLLQKKFDQYDDHLPFIITSVLALLVVVGCINLFVDLTENIHSDLVSEYDTKVTNYFTSIRNPFLNALFLSLTYLGDLYGYLVVTAISSIIFYLKFRNWRFVLETIFVLAISGLANLALKQVFNRARPDAEHLISVATLSYPSGHAMSAIAFYGFLIYLFYNFKIKKWIKAVVIVFLALLILGIGLSRIYLGVHYPSDIAGGFMAGFIWVMFCIVLFNIIDLLVKRRKRKREVRNKY